MNPDILVVSGWCGVNAAMLGTMFSAPRYAVLPCFAGGVVARLSRDIIIGAGASHVFATSIAAGLVVLTASVLIRRPGISPVVVVSALTPIGAVGPFFRAIVGFLRLSSVPADQLTDSVFALITNLSRVFTTTLALAIGVSAALLLTRALRELGAHRKRRSAQRVRPGVA